MAVHSAPHRARRRFGQHFLADPRYIARLVQSIAPQLDERIVEIGPGLGALTEPLLRRVHTLHVIEIDRDIVARLASRFPGEQLVIHQGDALQFDFSSLGSPLRVVGNLPYNISSPLLFRIADAAAAVRDCHFMLQREVVDRLAAPPGNKIYGRLSVMIQYRFEVDKLFDVPAGAFRPAPQVDSAFVRLTPYAELPWPARDERLLSEMVNRAFSLRRKTLRNALAGFIDAGQLSGLRIDPGLRPEQLPVEAFVRIANAVAASR